MLSQTHAHSSKQYVNPLWCLLVICLPFLGLLEGTNMCIWCFCAGENNVRMESLWVATSEASIHHGRGSGVDKAVHILTPEKKERERERIQKRTGTITAPGKPLSVPLPPRDPTSSLSPAPNLLVGLWIQSMDPSTHYRQSPPDVIISEDALRDTLRGVLHFSPKDFCQVDS